MVGFRSRDLETGVSIEVISTQKEMKKDLMDDKYGKRNGEEMARWDGFAV